MAAVPNMQPVVIGALFQNCLQFSPVVDNQGFELTGITLRTFL